MRQLPVLPPTTYSAPTPWSADKALNDWILPRVLELTYTAWDLEPFARDVGYDGPPFRWDPARRFLLRAELDAAFFHLYGISRDDAAYILDTFPIVRKNDEKAHGEYRTKRVILEVYDAMYEAIAEGATYRTRLDPPPAHELVAHERNTRPPWASIDVDAAAAAAARPALLSLPDEAWATPPGVTEDNIALFSLLAVLRRFARPVESKRVLLATILVRRPALALRFLPEHMKTHWIRVVGPEAEPIPKEVPKLDDFRRNPEDRAWGNAVNHLKGSHAVGIDPQTGVWTASPQLDALSTPDWIEGRAAVAVGLLAQIDLAQAEQNLISFRRGSSRGGAKKAVS